MYRRLSVKRKKEVGHRLEKRMAPVLTSAAQKPIEKNRVFMGDPPPPAGCGRMENLKREEEVVCLLMLILLLLPPLAALFGLDPT